MIRKPFMMMCIATMLTGCHPTPAVESPVDELYSRMSQEERIAQLRSMYMDDLFDQQGRLDTTQCRKLIPFGIGHFSQYASQKPMDPNVLRDRVAAVQDWLMHHTPNGIPALFHEEVLSAINAGCDVDFPFGANYQYLQEAIDSGLVSPEVLERAVKNVLRYKYRCGLFDKNPYLYSKEKIVLDTPEERQTSYEIATQSIVLLQNDSNLLPLASGSVPQKILLTGPNANTMWAMCGDYSFPAMTYFWKRMETDLDHPHVVTLLEGMRHRLPEGDTLLYSRGCDWTEEIETQFSQVGDQRSWEYELLHRKVDAGEEANREEALALADSADVIIAAMGENVMLCGENRDRKGLRLPGKQEEYVEALLATGKPVVLVVFGGRAQDIRLEQRLTLTGEAVSKPLRDHYFSDITVER